MAFGKKPGPARPEAPKGPPSGPILSEANLQSLEARNIQKQPQVAAEQVAKRLMPSKMLDPSTQEGRPMAALGFSPDDEANVVKTDDALGEDVEKARHQMQAFIGQLNADLPDGVNVQPYFMIPEPCWSGPCADFLARYLRLTPYARWNMLPLPKDHRSAEQLGVQSHPGPPPAAFVRNVEVVLMKLESEVKAADAAFEQAIEAEGKSNWDWHGRHRRCHAP